MQLRVALTGPPRVVLGRSTVDLTVPGDACTLEQVLKRLADAEPRIARYLQGAEGQPPAYLRPLLNDRLLEPAASIPDGATLTLVYATAGGRAIGADDGYERERAV
jgi:hypothetical protein